MHSNTVQQANICIARQECPTAQVYQLRSGSGGAAVADLLDALEADATALGVSHFAVSGPTLEEVFLAAAVADDAGDGAAGGAHAGPGGAHAAAEGEGCTGRAASRSTCTGNGVAARTAQGQAAGKRSHEGALMVNGKEGGGQAAPAANGIGLGPGSAAKADGAVELQAYQRDPTDESALAPSAPALGPLSPAETSVRHAESSGPPPASSLEAHAPLLSASGAGSERTARAGTRADDMAEAAAAAASDGNGAGGAAEKEAAAAEQASGAGMGGSGHDVALGRSSEHGGEFVPDGNPDREGLRQSGSRANVGAASRAGSSELAGSGATAADAEWTAVSLDEPSRGHPAMQQGGACAEGVGGGGGAFGRVLRRRHRRRLGWWVAFREMVRKRAIGAGAPAPAPIPALMVCELATCAEAARVSLLKAHYSQAQHAPGLLIRLQAMCNRRAKQHIVPTGAPGNGATFIVEHKW